MVGNGWGGPGSGVSRVGDLERWFIVYILLCILGYVKKKPGAWRNLLFLLGMNE